MESDRHDGAAGVAQAQQHLGAGGRRVSVGSRTACLPPATTCRRQGQGCPPTRVTCASQVHVLELLSDSVLKDQYFPS